MTLPQISTPSRMLTRAAITNGSIEKNFRANYLRSLGHDKLVEEHDRQALYNEALGGKVINTDRLVTLGKKIGIPDAHRDLVWLVLLGVRSVNRDSWDVVERCQRDQYRDIKHFLILLNTLTQINDSGAKPEGRMGTEAEKAALMTTLEAIDKESYSSPVGNSSHSSCSNTPRGAAPIVGNLRLHQLWHLYRKLLNSDEGEDSLVSYSDGSSSVLKSLDDILMTVFKDESVAYWCLDAIVTKFFDSRSYIFELKEKTLTPQDIDTLLLSMN